MRPTTESNLGWMISNGSGWNNHKTAVELNRIIAESPDELPSVPLGHAILVAPISDKPLGLRCALVKVLPRLTEIIEGQPYDDGVEDESKVDHWAWNKFGIEAELFASVDHDQQSEDASQYFIKKMQKAIMDTTK